MKQIAYIMAGGVGKRFWPVSRRSTPKQYQSIAGGYSLLYETVERIKELLPLSNIFIGTTVEQKEKVISQLKDFKESNLILEPESRNTAPCIALAVAKIKKHFPKAIMAVLPVDHRIFEKKKFLSTLNKAMLWASNSPNIVTLGILPYKPATGYGYMQIEEKVGEINETFVYKVNRFIEKPSFDLAVEFVRSGKYFWNSGIFIFSIETIWEAFKTALPSVFKGMEIIYSALETAAEEETIKQEFSKFPIISIDFGVMEKINNIVMLPGDFGWYDIGSWATLEELWEKDANGNVTTGDFFPYETSDCIIKSEKGLVATVGVKDLIIISTEDITLVCNKQKSEDIKKLVEMLEKDKNLKKYL